MTSDATIRAGLVAALRDVAGLSAYTHVPGQVNVPAAVVQRRQTRFDSTMARGSDDFEYVVTVLVSNADPLVAQAAMSEFLDTAAASSIKAAVEADATLGGVVDFARVREAGDEQIRNVSEFEYMAVDFVVEVTA